jgi:hypothetical protein
MLPLLRDNEGKKLQKKPLVGAEEKWGNARKTNVETTQQWNIET